MSLEFVLPELKDLLEDEEGEVTSEANYQYQKHLTYVYGTDFTKRDDAVCMLVHMMEVSAEYDFTMVDIALSLKLLTKFMLIFNIPKNQEVFEKTKKMIDRA